MTDTATTSQPTQTLASFLASLRYEYLPDEVVERIEEFFLDWVASALAGKDAKQVLALEGFARIDGSAARSGGDPLFMSEHLPALCRPR